MKKLKNINKALDLFHVYYDLLMSAGCTTEEVLEIAQKWCEPHRYYHTIEHLEDILNLIKKAETTNPEIQNHSEAIKLLKLIAIFHDVVYEITPGVNNELLSAEYMKNVCKNLSQEQVTIIYNAILDTKDHTKEPSSEISRIFLDCDLHGLIYGSLSKKIEDEKKIFKEFGFVDYAIYKEVRGGILKKFMPHINKINPNSKMEEYIDWFENRQVNIAIFPGSFFPYHAGHHDILTKAEKTFDKVILAFGINTAKSHDFTERLAHMEELKKQMPNHQIESFEGILTDYVNTKTYPVTIVKGLRNITDFDFEKVQLRYLEDLSPNIKMMYIVCDRAYEHISSSGIRQLQKYNAPSGNELIKKYIPFHE